jgi:hypothetical protein
MSLPGKSVYPNPAEAKRDYANIAIKEEVCENHLRSEGTSDLESEEIKVSKGLSMQLNYSKVCLFMSLLALGIRRILLKL